MKKPVYLTRAPWSGPDIVSGPDKKNIGWAKLTTRNGLSMMCMVRIRVESVPEAGFISELSLIVIGSSSSVSVTAPDCWQKVNFTLWLNLFQQRGGNDPAIYSDSACSQFFSSPREQCVECTHGLTHGRNLQFKMRLASSKLAAEIFTENDAGHQEKTLLQRPTARDPALIMQNLAS